jgi:hypothetical protein
MQETFNSGASEQESELSDFSADSASDYNLSRLLSMALQMKDWIQVMQPKINEMILWQRDIGPVITEIFAHQRESSKALQDIISELHLLRSYRVASELTPEAMQLETRRIKLHLKAMQCENQCLNSSRATALAPQP